MSGVGNISDFGVVPQTQIGAVNISQAEAIIVNSQLNMLIFVILCRWNFLLVPLGSFNFYINFVI